MGFFALVERILNIFLTVCIDIVFEMEKGEEKIRVES